MLLYRLTVVLIFSRSLLYSFVSTFIIITSSSLQKVPELSRILFFQSFNVCSYIIMYITITIVGV